MDWMYAFFKVGDQSSNAGMKDGMPVFWIDPNEWNPVISDDMQKIFACVKVPLSWKPDLIEAVKPTGDPLSPKATDRPRSKLISLDSLGDSILVNNLREKGKKVPIIDGMKLSKDIFKTDLNAPAIDNNAIATGSANVGSGETYTTWAAAFADIANLTGNLTFTQTSAVTETAESLVTENLGTYTFTCTSDTPHNGDPTSGHLTTINSATNFMKISASGSGIIDIYDLNLKSAGSLNRGVLVALTTFTGNIKYHDNLYDGNNRTNATGFQCDDSDPVMSVWNLLIWDVPGVVLGGMYISAFNGSSNIENVTIYGCAQGITNNNQAVTYKNFILFNNTANFAGNANSTSEYCATDAVNVGAATDNNEQAGLTIADEVESTTDTDSTFMKVKAGGSCVDNGTTPGIAANTTGIRGNNRPSTDGNISIGADEYAYHGAGARISNFSEFIEEPDTLW